MNLKQNSSRAQSRLNGAVNSVVEKLEDRRLMAGNATLVQSLPYTLEFDAQRTGLTDRDGEGTGFSYIASGKLAGGAEYRPDLIDLDAATGRLKLTTTGSSTAGGNWENDNSLVNALQTGFNATTAGGFTMSTRLVGPLGFLKNASEQGGLVFGPDQDNYVKLVAVAQPNGQSLQFVDEQKTSIGFTHALASQYTNIGAFANISTLDLVLAGDAATGKITAYYKINGGPLVPVNQTLTLSGAKKDAFFSTTAKGGVMAMQKNNLEPVTVTFERFEITNGTPEVSRPSVRADLSSPANGVTDVWRDAFVAAAVNLPNVGKGINGNSLHKGNVFLYRTSDRQLVPAHLTTSGAGDAIILQPNSALDANTSYTFEVTSGLRDTGGAAFLPYKATFTTGNKITPTDPNLAFEKVALPSASGQSYTSVTVGPDHRLYATTLSGLIQRFDINVDGTLGAAQNITTVQTASGSNRMLTGITFDPASTADNLIAWVSHGEFAAEAATDWTGKVSRLSGANLQTYQDYITNLPRSVRDHLNNQIVFKDGAMYFCQSSNTAMGAADVVWGSRPEHLLSGAILKVDVGAIAARIANGQGALNVQTEGRGAANYDPFAANAPVKIYASGVRNAYDLVWTRDGKLYAPTNGSAAGGNTPSYPNSVFGGQRIDEGTAGPYNGGNVEGLTNVNQTQNDYLFKIEDGGYYGHPNPTRNEYVLNGGNPNAGPDESEVTGYPVGTQVDRNYRGAAYNFGQNHSPDGIIEYQGNAFNGALDGKLLVTRYSGGADIMVLTRGADGNITDAKANIAGLGGFTNPLDLTQDLSSGFLYVADHGAQTIVLARPIAPGAKIAVEKSTLYFNDDYLNGNTVASKPQAIRITNNGSAPLSIPSGGFTLSDGSNWQIVSRPTLPRTIGVGESVELTVAFKAVSTGGAGVRVATLTIASNDANNPNLVVKLRGLATPNTGGQNEASLQRILGDLYQFPINVGDINKANTNLYSSAEPLSPANDEIYVQRLQRATSGPVTIEPLGTFAGGSPAVRFGYYDAGTPTARTELFTVGLADAQTVNPTLVGVTSFDPGSKGFGIYATFPIFGNTAYSEDALNTKENVAADRRKVRFYALKNADGTVVPNAFIFTSEDYVNDPTGGYDTNDFIGIIRNVTPANLDGGEIGLENLDGVPFADRLIFNRIQQQPPDKVYNPATKQFDIQPPDNVVHDTAVLRVRNSGNQNLTINSLTLSNMSAWTVVNPPANCTVIPVGGWLDITVKFVAQVRPNITANQTIDTTGANRYNGGVYDGALTINSDDSDEPITSVALAGWWQAKSESNMEPSLPTMVNLIYGYRTTVLSAGQSFAPGTDAAGQVKALGEEVLSRYWVRADTSTPVAVRQLAAYHSQGNTATVSWAARGSTGLSQILTHVGVDGQSLLPRNNAAGNGQGLGMFNGPNASTANPERAFQFKIDSEWSDDTMNPPPAGQPQDQGHHVRFFPARDQNGQLIPNTWLMCMDYQGINYDYQDNLYLVTNMKPAAPAAPAMPTAEPQGPGIRVNWADNTDPLLSGYNVYRSTSATTGFTKITPSALTASEMLDTSAAAGTTYYYKVSAVDSWGGESALSGAASAARSSDTNPPAVPTGLSATSASSGIQLNWTANSEADLAGYRVYRSSAADGAYALISGAQPVSAASFLDATAQSGQRMYYKVSAVDTSGNESSVSASADAVRVDTAPPAVPAGLSATGNNSGIVLNWSAVGDGDLAGYRIYRSASAASGFAAMNGGALASGTSLTDATVAVGERWYYQITAVDASGNESAAGDTADAARTATAPFSLRVNVGGSAFTDSQGRVWSADTGFIGGTASTGAFAVAGTEDDALYYNRRWGAFSYALNVPDGQYTLKLSFADPLYTTAGKRVFDVRAEGATILSNFDVAAEGGGQAVLTKTFTVTVTGGKLDLQLIKKIENPILSAIEVTGTGTVEPETPPPGPDVAPAAPKGLTPTASNTAVALSWTANAESDLAGYNVYRSTSADGTFEKLNGSLLTVARFSDTTGTAGATMYYRVTAVDAAGNESAAATTSAMRSLKDTTPPAKPANFTVGSTVGGITLNWTANAEADLNGYNLYRSTSQYGTYVKVNGGYIRGTSYTDAAAQTGVRSFYKLIAWDTAGNASATATVSAVRTS